MVLVVMAPVVMEREVMAPVVVEVAWVVQAEVHLVKCAVAPRVSIYKPTPSIVVIAIMLAAPTWFATWGLAPVVAERSRNAADLVLIRKPTSIIAAHATMHA